MGSNGFHKLEGNPVRWVQVEPVQPPGCDLVFKPVVLKARVTASLPACETSAIRSDVLAAPDVLDWHEEPEAYRKSPLDHFCRYFRSFPQGVVNSFASPSLDLPPAGRWRSFVVIIAHRRQLRGPA